MMRQAFATAMGPNLAVCQLQMGPLQAAQPYGQADCCMATASGCAMTTRARESAGALRMA